MQKILRRLGRDLAAACAARSPEEREKRAANAWALVVVCAVALGKYVSGLTDRDAPFTLYAAAVVVGAVRGGFEPALVATLASLVLGGLAAPLPAQGGARLAFAAEGLAIALLVSALRSRAQASDAARRGAEVTIDELRQRGYAQTADERERHRQWDEYREAAARAQAALQRAADETRQQLAALESLTDPSLNPLEGPAAVSELLERLRTMVGADGAAMVSSPASGGPVVAAGGLQPRPRPLRANGLSLTPGRVAVVHNDPSRVEQLSAMNWSPGVASLLLVPVMHDGQVRSAIEIASERSRQVNDWDVALARVVADRLAAVAVRQA